MLIMLAGGPANTSWIAGAAGARDACRSGGNSNTSWTLERLMLMVPVALPIQAGSLGRLMLMMLAGAVASPIQAGSLRRLMLVLLAGGLDAHNACRWPCQYKLDCWGGWCS